MDTGGKEFDAFLHAFALGCLEREDYDVMMEYFKSNQDFPWQELGEYQNLVALLPSFLDIEVPDAQVKDRVARKLYRLRDQQRPQRNTQVIPQGSPVPHTNLFQRIETPEQKLFSQISSPVEENIEQPPLEEYNESPVYADKPVEFEAVTSEPAQPEIKQEEPENEDEFKSPFAPDYKSTREEEPNSFSSSNYGRETVESSFSSGIDESSTKESFEDKEEYSFESSLSNYAASTTTPHTDETFTSFSSETIIEEPHEDPDAPQRAQTPPEPVRKGISGGVFFLFILILAAAVGAVYYYLSKEIKTVTAVQADKYEKVVQSLKQEVASSKEVNELLASINLQMVSLKSTPKAAGAYGKLLFDSVSRKAMLQVVNLPILSSDKSYQLWVISNNQKVSAGLYSVSASQQYFPVSNFNGLNLNGATTFLITEETINGGEKPSKDVYLVGQFTF